MRTHVLLPLTALVLVTAGCGPGRPAQSGHSRPKRDLAFPAQAPEVAFASPVELGQVRHQPPTTHPSRRPIRHRSVQRSSAQPALAAAAVTPTMPQAVPVPAAQPARPTSEPVNDRELLPGKTVTVIPASYSPSTGGIETDDLPIAGTGGSGMGGGGSGMGGGGSGMGGGGSGMGGDCPGRGRGIGPGIAGLPRPDFR